MKCIILRNEEITEEECQIVCRESGLAKNSKALPKKFKRIVGWNAICKACPYHKEGEKRK
ncbi:MAG: hypothetical protein ACI4HI_02860 [Lachnospiraceae bacterium]